MAEQQPEKTATEKLKDVVSQLKEMEHYARNNMETLSEIWLLLEEQFKKRNKQLAERANDLLKSQGALEDLLKQVIPEFEKECTEPETKAPKKP
jgi:hypothetical protein